MIKNSIEIIELTETKKKGRVMTRKYKGYWLFWSVVEIKETATEGVGFLVKSDRLIAIV